MAIMELPGAVNGEQPALGRFATFRGQFVRYGLSSGLLLLAKLCLIFLLIQWLHAWAAYLAVHVLIFFMSYALHSLVTFRRPLCWPGIRRYFAAVIVFKAFDYGVFNLLFVSLQMTATWCVLFASLSEAVLRFLLVRKALHREVQMGTSPGQPAI